MLICSSESIFEVREVVSPTYLQVYRYDIEPDSMGPVLCHDILRSGCMYARLLLGRYERLWRSKLVTTSCFDFYKYKEPMSLYNKIHLCVTIAIVTCLDGKVMLHKVIGC